MTETTPGVRIRPLDELDISDIVAIDEKISGRYRPRGRRVKRRAEL